MLASQEGRTDVVELLIKYNADLDARKEVRFHTQYNFHWTRCRIRGGYVRVRASACAPGSLNWYLWVCGSNILICVL